jgi:hypothetical protein
MKSITRLSLALMMFSLFSISYLVTSVSAQNGTKCGKANNDWCTNAEMAASQGKAVGAPGMGAPAPFDDGLMGAPAMGAPGTMGHNSAPGTQGNAPTGGYAPGTRGHTPGMNPGMPGGYAPGTQGNATGGYAPGEVFDPFRKGHPSISSPGMAPQYGNPAGGAPGYAPR